MSDCESSSWSLLMPPTSPPKSNLERFLQCVTPVPRSRFLSQREMYEVNSLWQVPGGGNNKNIVEYFTLEDLWKCYEEWSACGAGTQVKLDYGDSVIQYYVPYLSAIQLYTHKSVVVSPRNPREYNDGAEFESDFSSDESMGEKLSRSLSNDSSKTWDSISDDSNFEHETSLPLKDRLGNLYFEYFEYGSPYSREPLSTKISELAKKIPGLLTLRNVDLSPASWMAVAWYPIYHIPTRVNEKDLSACFLTFHTLSSSLQDYGDEDEDISVAAGGSKQEEKKSSGIPLAPFGLASYKMQGDLWVDPLTFDQERLMYLYSAADSWLKQLNVHHHDYNFFTYHSAI